MNLCKIQTPCFPAPSVALLPSCSYGNSQVWIDTPVPINCLCSNLPYNTLVKTSIRLLYLERPRAGILSRQTIGGVSLPLITGLCGTWALGDSSTGAGPCLSICLSCTPSPSAMPKWIFYDTPNVMALELSRLFCSSLPVSGVPQGSSWKPHSLSRPCPRSHKPYSISQSSHALP